MTSRDYNIGSELKRWLKGAKRIVIAGIGNPIRMDDFVGVRIVQDMKGKVPDKVMLIECETVPESHMQQIIEFNPTHILLVDAALLGLDPGESRLTEPDTLVNSPAISTHILPLRVFCDYVGRMTNSRISILLIQPEQTDFGEELSPKINAVARGLTATLLKATSNINA